MHYLAVQKRGINMLTLGDLHIGQDAIIRVVGGESELRHRLLIWG